MTQLLCLCFAAVIGASFAKPPWAGMGEKGPGGPGGEEAEMMSPEMIMLKLKMLTGLESHIREKTEQMIAEKEDLDDVHEDFIRYLHFRKQFEMAQAMKDKGDLLKMAFQHFMEKMSEMKEGEKEAGDTGFGGHKKPSGPGGETGFGGPGGFGGQKGPGGESGPSRGPGDSVGFGGQRRHGGEMGFGGPEGFGGDKRGGDKEKGGPKGQEGEDDEMDMGEKLKLMAVWKLFVEFETAWLQQNNIVALGLDEKTTRGLFFETFGRFMKNAMMIKEKAESAEKLQQFIQESQEKAKESSMMKEKFMQFFQMVQSRNNDY